MTILTEAVFEGGVLRPLEEMPLAEGRRVSLVVRTGWSPPAAGGLGIVLGDDLADDGPAPTQDEIWAINAGIPGSMAEAIRAERDGTR